MIKTNATVEKELLKGFDEPSSEIQEKACIQAVKDIRFVSAILGSSNDFLLELRDFLLDYNKTI